MKEHDRQMVEAELECCRVQILFWRKRFGPKPEHPLELAFLHLMQDATRYYEGALPQ